MKKLSFTEREIKLLDDSTNIKRKKQQKQPPRKEENASGSVISIGDLEANMKRLGELSIPKKRSRGFLVGEDEPDDRGSANVSRKPSFHEAMPAQPAAQSYETDESSIVSEESDIPSEELRERRHKGASAYHFSNRSLPSEDQILDKSDHNAPDSKKVIPESTPISNQSQKRFIEDEDSSSPMPARKSWRKAGTHGDSIEKSAGKNWRPKKEVEDRGLYRIPSIATRHHSHGDLAKGWFSDPSRAREQSGGSSGKEGHSGTTEEEFPELGKETQKKMKKHRAAARKQKVIADLMAPTYSDSNLQAHAYSRNHLQ